MLAKVETKKQNLEKYKGIISKSLFSDIKNLAEKLKGLKVIHINSTPRGVWVFRLTVVPEPEWETRGMPKTSEFSQRQFINKIVGYYHIDIGSNLTDKFR